MPPKAKAQPEEELAPWEREDTPGGEVVEATAADVVPAGMGPAMMNLIEWFASRATTEDEQFAALERMMAQVLNAEDVEEVLREKMLISGKDLVGRPLVVYGFDLQEGEYEEGPPFYAVLDATVEQDPTHRSISVGGWMVLAQLRKLDDLGEWPQTLMIDGKKTRKGFTALNLRRVS